MSYEIHVTQRANGEWYVRTVGDTGSTVFHSVPTNPRFAPARLRMRGFSMREAPVESGLSYGQARKTVEEGEADTTIAPDDDEQNSAETRGFGME